MAHKALAALGITAAAVLGAPWAIGLKVESDFRAAIAAAPAHYPYPVTLLRYQRGWFGAEAETRQLLDLGPDADAITFDDEGQPVLPPNRSVPLTVLHRISHGPRLDGLRLARIVNTLKPEGDWLGDLRSLFGAAEPLTLTVDVGLAGGLSGTLVSPPFDQRLPGADGADATTLTWAGLDARFDLDGRQVQGRLDAPGLSRDGDGFALGPTTMTLDATVVADGVWTGRFASHLASLRARSPEGALTITDLQLDSDSADTGGTLKSGVTMAIKAMQFDALRIDDTRLRIVLDRIDTAALSTLSGTLNRQAAGGAGSAPMAEELQPALAAIAAGQPLLVVETLSFTAPQGKAEASGRVQYVGDSRLDDFAPLADLAVGAKIDLPMPLLELLLQAQVIRSTTAPGLDGELHGPSPEQVTAGVSTMLSGLVSQGLLLVDNGRGRSEVDFRAGALTVNGTPLAPPPT